MEAIAVVLALPEPAITLFVEYAGFNSRHINPEFASAAEYLAAKMITQAMRFNYLKSRDSCVYPKVFKRHALVYVSKSLGIEFMSATLAHKQHWFMRLAFGESLNYRFEGVEADPVVVEQYLNNFKGLSNEVPRADDFRVLTVSARKALAKYKQFLFTSSIEFMITHVDISLIKF